jgi:hypothetical protein
MFDIKNRTKHRSGVLTASKETFDRTVVWNLEILLATTIDSKFILSCKIVFNKQQQLLKTIICIEELSVVGYETVLGTEVYVSYV